jgi:hypothetical protein
VFPQPVGPELAKLTYQPLYGQETSDQVPGNLAVLRDMHLGRLYTSPNKDFVIPLEDGNETKA